MNRRLRGLPGGRWARLASSAGGGIAVQVVAAGGSLIVQVFAARTLGVAGYGTYALLYAALVMVTAVQTSWVGDTLTVFDRFDRRIRGALVISVLGLTAAGAVVALVVALTMGRTTLTGALVFALLTALWLVNETGRRVFTARMEFWRLVLNDAAYYAVTLVIIAACTAGGIGMSLATIMAAMCAGLLVSIVLARLRLPGEEFARAPMRGAAVGEVFEFAGWRSVQAALRPLSLFLARAMIALAASPAVLGGIEAARLLLAPALTIVNGSGYFFLGRFAEAERSGRPARASTAARAGLALGALTFVPAIAAVLLVDQLEPLLTGGSFPVDRVALIGWMLYAVTFAATMPLSNLATARRLSRLFFVVRGIESVIGLSVLAVVLVADPGWATLAPYCLGGGGLVSTVVLWSLLRGRDPGPAGSRDADESEDRSSAAHVEVNLDLDLDLDQDQDQDLDVDLDRTGPVTAAGDGAAAARAPGS